MIKTNGIVVLLAVLLSCDNKRKESSQDFELLPRNSYFIDSFDGIGIYRLNESGEVMDGYYVIGDKISKWEEFYVVDGVLNGDYIVFHSNGAMYSHSQYENGKLHGVEKIYSLAGKLQTVNTYHQGKLYGKKLGYFENGQLESESTMDNEEIIESVSYNQIGEIISQMYIKDGLKIRQTISGGKVFSEEITSTYDNFNAMKYYNQDGSVKLYFRMLQEDDDAYIIELDKNNNEIKRIDVEANPQEIMKYMQYIRG